MPLATLDPRTALIVIDLQKGLASVPAVHPLADVVRRARALAAAFRARGMPVVQVTADGLAPGRTDHGHPDVRVFPGDFAELLPELGAQPDDHRVVKRTWGAFTNTDLGAYLRSAAVTQVVVCGVATSMGVESTARQAHELGYNVAVAVDAMTDLSLEAHENSVARVFPRLGETATTQEVIALARAGR